MAKHSVRDLQVKGRRVLARVDFNVPTEETDNGPRITDDTRIRESLPTIDLIRKQGGKVVLLAHFGRPKGKPNPKYSLKPVAQRLGELLGTTVEFSPEVVGPAAEAATKALPDGGGLLVENVRFYEGGEANDPEVARQLAGVGDVYVNYPFCAAHRPHAITAGVAQCLQPARLAILLEP